jgi:nanoRNase/pAp phosphatase (c-di-AMP/oligoRNAs hydrolase)
MNPAISQEINLLRDFLAQQNELGILIGSHQNLDTYASSLALYLTLTQSGKKVQIVSKKEPTVEVSNLVGIDKVRDSFIGSTNKLVVALPYVKGEVEKVLFTEAPNTINFHLTAAPDRSITPFDLSDVKLIWEGGAPSAIITLGVGSVDEINGVIDPNSTKIVNIDNYQGNTRFGDVVLVDDSFSSLSEIVGKVVKDLQLPQDRDIAQNILDGVLYATRNFTKQNTSPLAFEAVSNAMYMGAQRKGEEQQQQPRREQQQSFQNQPRQNRGQDRPNRDQRQGQNQSQNRQNRVSDVDFPAMHMQRPSNPTRGVQSTPQRPQPQFTQNRNQDDIRNKIMEESRMQDPVIDEEQVMTNAPIEEVQMPEEPQFTPQSTEEIPDDWLMPKVFKSSKNNN